MEARLLLLHRSASKQHFGIRQDSLYFFKHHQCIYTISLGVVSLYRHALIIIIVAVTRNAVVLPWFTSASLCRRFTDVLHTVGPIGNRPQMLRSCYKKCLDTMKENNLCSIVSTVLYFKFYSSGVYSKPWMWINCFL